MILHDDVVGSTSLIQLDKTLAHARIRDAFARLRESVHAYSGNTREIRGGALVAEFALHMLMLDGAYTFTHDRARFHRAPAPSDAELGRLLEVGIELPWFNRIAAA